MANNRLDQVVSTIVEAVRGAVRDENISFEEYRAAIGYMMKIAESGELPLFIDVFLNTSIVSVINQNAHPAASPSDMEGPYFLDSAPVLEDGKMKTMDAYADDQPMIVRGTVKDVDGQPLADVLVDMWNSTPDGKYGGIHEGIPVDYYRGKVRTDAQGQYQFESTVPVAYKIPDSGPTGALLEMMGRHSWRPAHVHLKVRHPGYRDLTTQLYFAEDEYTHSDCCEGIVPEQFIYPELIEDGKRVLEADLVIEPQAESQMAA
ncbi:dioxygenase [Alterisphingorhabdus coralli]|uniref:Dioxygenase n=1 Tax=Alterisphingorhabdus coralli TaxID=3071408 RepID=A0AA97I228_9SPHN|nr:dioxygenase [Parasphingorhabdus sp. SCSIO 66989]WOE75350.1 dioxygenase [Parasphingorhabdus sp. SCSIO 66989]